MLSCLADTEAPNIAEVDGSPPAVHLLVQGSSGTNFFLSYSDSSGEIHEFKDEGQLKINLAGELRLFLEFDREISALTNLKAALQTSTDCTLESCACRIDSQSVNLSKVETVFINLNRNNNVSCTALVRS